MVWYFIVHCALLAGLFIWLDRRQMDRYNLFSQWTQIVSPMLSDDIKNLLTELESIERKSEATNKALERIMSTLR